MPSPLLCNPMICERLWKKTQIKKIVERIKDHSGRGHTSHMLKRNIEISHIDVDTANLKIININFSNNKKKWKIAESLWIKDLRPALNLLEKSIPLKLYN